MFYKVSKDNALNNYKTISRHWVYGEKRQLTGR